MNAVSGWNLHSVIEAASTSETDTVLKTALEVVDSQALEWLGRSVAELTTLKCISTIPKVRLTHLRELGDRLKFITIPFAYLDPRSYAEESDEMKRSIKRFADILSPTFHPYVLCPLNYYSLPRHIEAREDLPVMVPEEYAPVFQMLEMCLPVFRGIKNDIAELRRKLEMNIRAQQERERLRLRDPLMVAVPKNESLHGTGMALIGPAWGPDLDDILLANFNLTAKPEQRRMIEGTLGRLLTEGKPQPMSSTPPVIEPRGAIDMDLLLKITKGFSGDVVGGVLRFLEGDHSIEPPTNGTSYTVSEMARVTHIGKLSMLYLQHFRARR